MINRSVRSRGGHFLVDLHCSVAHNNRSGRQARDRKLIGRTRRTEFRRKKRTRRHDTVHIALSWPWCFHARGISGTKIAAAARSRREQRGRKRPGEEKQGRSYEFRGRKREPCKNRGASAVIKSPARRARPSFETRVEDQIQGERDAASQQRRFLFATLHRYAPEEEERKRERVVKILHTVDARVGRRCRVVRIDEVIGRLGSAAGPDFRVAVRAQGVVFLRLGLALTDLVRFVQRRRGRTASAHLSVPVAIRLQSDGIGFHIKWHVAHPSHLDPVGSLSLDRTTTVRTSTRSDLRPEPLSRVVTW